MMKLTDTSLKQYPLSLQVLMQTDGTVTDLVRLLVQEELQVVKLSEQVDDNTHVLHRQIYLQGRDSGINWVYAQSDIYLSCLPEAFVSDLLDRSIPIGTLWTQYRMETYKTLIDQSEQTVGVLSEGLGCSKGSTLLSRTYEVVNQGNIIMVITEQFPVESYMKKMKTC